VYGKRLCSSTNVVWQASTANGIITIGGEGSEPVRWSRTARLDENTQTLCLDCMIEYPSTTRQGYGKLKAQRLGRTWDAKWEQTAPCEFVAF
jgi:hypothetical protein